MNNYFEDVRMSEDYFAKSVTSKDIPAKPSPLTSVVVRSSTIRPVEPRSVMDNVVNTYGEKRSGVVVRRYALK